MLPSVLSLKLSASGLTRTDLEKKATEQTPELITPIFREDAIKTAGFLLARELATQVLLCG